MAKSRYWRPSLSKHHKQCLIHLAPFCYLSRGSRSLYVASYLHAVGQRNAESEELLLREEDVQVLHGFDSRASAESYLKSALFGNDVVRELKPYLLADPEVRV